MRIASFTVLLILIMNGQISIAQDSFLVNPYLQYATKDAISVLWETTNPATTIVRYGEALLNAKEPNLALEKKLTGTRLFHEVRLDNLKVHTKYLYQVVSKFPDGKSIESEVYTFSTAVDDEDAFYFAFIGDTQENPTTPWAWEKIAKQIFGKRPNFIVHAGDLVDDGHIKFHWTNRFFKKGQETMSRYPMFTTLGNHEGDSPLYYQYMANPAPEYYYSITYGNAQFFFIDTNRDVSERSEQYFWLEGALAKSKATWKFVVHHHPPYSTEENDHGDSWIGQSEKGTHARDLVPLYETYGVDFCLFGHTHVYERTWPLFKNAINMNKGVIYINSGGAGGGLEDFDPIRSWFTRELQRKTHHYCTFAVYDDYLSFNAISTDNNIFDSFQLTKKNNKTSFVQPPAPIINAESKIFIKQLQVSMETRYPANKTYYTLDGTNPTQQSAVYESPLTLSKSKVIKARSYDDKGKASRVIVKNFERKNPQLATKLRNPKRGVSYKYYKGSNWNMLPDFSQLTPTKHGKLMTITEDVTEEENNYGLVFEGYFNVSETGVFTLYTESDDGSKVYVNKKLVVDNDGSHAMRLRKGEVALEKGWHHLKVEYYQGGGGKGLNFGLITNGYKRPFHPNDLSH